MRPSVLEPFLNKGFVTDWIVAMVIYYGMNITLTCSPIVRHLRETNIVTSVDKEM